MLPPQISNYESRNETKDDFTDTGGGSESRNVALNEVEVEECSSNDEDDEEETDRWVVKLHPDSGQTYFVDAMSDLATWMNPFEAEQNNEIFEKITLEAEDVKKTPIDETEKLSGFEDVPNREVFFSDYVKSAQSRLQKWVDRSHLAVSDTYGAMLKYPEYVNMEVPEFEQSAVITVSLRLPRGLSEQSGGDTISSITTKQSLADSVGKMMDSLFKKFQMRNGRALDNNGTDGYIFKLIGFQEFMLHQDFLLGHYDCATSAYRTKVGQRRRESG